MTSTPAPKALEDIIVQTVEEAVAGSLNDSTRVALYRLALTVVANEFYRIESESKGSVDPQILLLLQQIVLLCDDNLDMERLTGGINTLLEKVNAKRQKQDGRRGLIIAP